MVGGACASPPTLPGHRGDQGGPQLRVIKENTQVHVVFSQGIFLF